MFLVKSRKKVSFAFQDVIRKKTCQGIFMLRLYWQHNNLTNTRVNSKKNLLEVKNLTTNAFKSDFGSV